MVSRAGSRDDSDVAGPARPVSGTGVPYRGANTRTMGIRGGAGRSPQSDVFRRHGGDSTHRDRREVNVRALRLRASGYGSVDVRPLRPGRWT
jgi:hypothetical protein